MRSYHRWLSVVFGIFILWIATTGVLSQFAALYANGGFEQETAERGKQQAAAIGHAIVPTASAHEGEEQPAAFTCPADMTCRPKAPPSGARAWVGFFHHIHSGEQFGPVGVIISIMSGLALMFFAISGMWMYYVMFRNRGRRDRTGSRFFWK